MFLTKEYKVSDADQFIPDNYPEIAAELAIMCKDMRQAPVYYRREIAVSYFRDHCLTQQWITTNPELTKLITSGSYKGAHIEALFDACRRQPVFLAAYEAYLHGMFADDNNYSSSLDEQN